jgi:methylated-DNA-[protein]-cysteine S-methyltransferase
MSRAPSRNGRAAASYGVAATEIGPLFVAVIDGRLLSVKFGVDEKRAFDAAEEVERETHGAYALERDDAAIGAVAAQLCEYLAGQRTSIDVRCELGWVTGFRREVLLACAAIPRGQVATYAELARRVGRPAAFRAVGNTMRTNPIPIVIPCHRVIGSDGSLTGFGGGLDVKRRLLELEGALLA